jgi:hypothetical protein
MAKKGRKTEGATGNRVLDLRSTGVTRSNISPAGVTALVVVWRKVKASTSFLLQIEGSI